MEKLCLRLFGPFAVTLNNAPNIDFEYDKARALLAFLSVEDQRPHRRDELCGLLWPEVEQSRARQSLSQALYSLRRSLSAAGVQAEYLISDRATVQMNPAAACRSDVGDFLALSDAAAATDEGQEKSELLAQAIDHYSGPFLHGFSLPDSSAWDEWALLQRERLHRRAGEILRDLVDMQRAAGRLEESLGWARRLVELDPWQEESHRQVIEVLAGLGRRSEALAQFERCRHILANELNTEPTEESWALYRSLLAGTPPTSNAAKSDGNGAFASHRLPLPRTGFVGRHEELDQIARRLADPECRLLTIVGLGGMGKTQLALHAASAQQGNFADGVVYVPLVAVTTEEGILSAIRSGLGGVPGTSFQELAARLRALTLLLVLDNCEQLHASTGVFARLLNEAPNLKILATSRERLNLQEEWLLPLEGLPSPQSGSATAQPMDPASLADFPSTRLFVNCLRRLRPGLHISAEDAGQIAHICRLVEGMPLALELTAAWHRLLPLAAIAKQVSHILDLPPAPSIDLPARHRSIGDVFAYSWEMLPNAAADQLRHLSLFRGGFTLEAAEAVAGAGLADLAELVDHCWVRVDERGRYDLHELVRQFCAEQLASQGAEVTALAHQRHAAYFAALLKPQEDRYNRESSALAETTVEIGNIEVAWDWATSRGDAAIAYPLYMSLFFIGDMWGWFGLANALFDRGVERFKEHLAAEQLPEEHLDAATRLIAHILHAQAGFALKLSRASTVMAYAREAEKYARQATPGPEQRFILIYTRQAQASAYVMTGHFAEAETILRQEAIPYWESAPPTIYQGPDFSLGNNYMALGWIYHAKGDYTGAVPILEHALAIQKRCNVFRQRAITYRVLGQCYSALGRREDGLQAAAESVHLSREYGDQANLSMNLLIQGYLLLESGDVQAARASCLEARRLAKEMGNWGHYSWANIRLAAVELAEDRLDSVTALVAEAQALYQREGMESIGLLGEIRLMQGRRALAAGEAGQAAAIFHQILEMPHIPPPQRKAAEEALAALANAN